MNSETPVLDSKTQWFLKFLKEQNRPEIFDVPVETARQMQITAQAMFPGAKLPVDLEDRTIPVGPRGKLDLRIFRPAGGAFCSSGSNVFSWRRLGIGQCGNL